MRAMQKGRMDLQQGGRGQTDYILRVTENGKCVAENEKYSLRTNFGRRAKTEATTMRRHYAWKLRCNGGRGAEGCTGKRQGVLQEIRSNCGSKNGNKPLRNRLPISVPTPKLSGSPWNECPVGGSAPKCEDRIRQTRDCNGNNGGGGGGGEVECRCKTERRSLGSLATPNLKSRSTAEDEREVGKIPK